MLTDRRLFGDKIIYMLLQGEKGESVREVVAFCFNLKSAGSMCCTQCENHQIIVMRGAKVYFVCVCAHAQQLRSDLPEKTSVSCIAASQTSAHIYFLWKISNTEKGPLGHSCSQILTQLSWRPAAV